VRAGRSLPLGGHQVAVTLPGARLRLGVYCDYRYRTVGGAVSAELPFSIFVEGLARFCDRLVVFGRLDSRKDEEFPFKVREAQLVGLPNYTSGADLLAVLRAVPVALRRFWRELDELDTIWVLGPNPPQAILFALLGIVRGRRVVLGVRQNLPELIRHRRPGRRAVLASAYLLEWGFRMLARAVPVIVVGPDLARRYRGSRAVLDAYVSLLRDVDLDVGAGVVRDYDGDELVMLSVGRLDPEKNPLLMADILAVLVRQDPRWRLEVCGDGTQMDEIRLRAEELGVGRHLILHGYVPIDDGLWEYYRAAHALLHVSLTEGVPQVILEAFAAGLPVVATDVGGVAELVAGRGLVCPPGDASACVAALQRVASEPELRGTLIAAGRTVAAAHTLEAECASVAGFLSMNS
jgi:glycosyltransferase involved in cell wall biosynthesis